MNTPGKTRYIVFDGADGTGKTTQLKLLGKLLEEKYLMKVHYSRLLGGDGKDWVQNQIRKLLLDPEFPGDSVNDEEELFGVTDRRGIMISRSKLAANSADIVLQDRGWPSHVCYAAAKDMTENQIHRVHSETKNAYHGLAMDYDLIHVVMVPEDERMAMERVKGRGEQVTPRLENLETQRRVIEALRGYPEGPFSLHMGEAILLTVTRGQGISEVHSNVLAALRQAGLEI
jgi:thymidylate kinase